MVASTTPRSTRAICRSERRTEGRSQLTVAATQKISAATATMAMTIRRANRRVRTVCAISRSILDRYLTKRDATSRLLKRKELDRRPAPGSFGFTERCSEANRNARGTKWPAGALASAPAGPAEPALSEAEGSRRREGNDR